MLHKCLYTVSETSELTSIGRSHLYRYIASGALRTVKVGRSTRIHRDDLEAFIESLRSATQHEEVSR